jgi:hypothetical protein
VSIAIPEGLLKLFSTNFALGKSVFESKTLMQLPDAFYQRGSYNGTVT